MSAIEPGRGETGRPRRLRRNIGLAGTRHDQRRGVQHHAGRIGAAIGGIAHHRDAQPLKGMHANLVRTSGGRAEFHQSATVLRAKQRPGRYRRFSGGITLHPPAGLRSRCFGEWQVDLSTLPIRHPVQNRDIALGNDPCLERLLEAGMGLRIARQQQAAAGIAIEPVHGMRPSPKSERQVRQMVFKADPTFARRINRQTGGFVDYKSFAVQEQHMFTYHGEALAIAHDLRPEGSDMRRLTLVLLVVAAPAEAQLCNGANVAVEPDGRSLGHFPYGDASPDVLVPVGPGFALGQCRLRAEAAADLERLLTAAANDPAVQGRLWAFSCHRTLQRQQSTFCRTRESADGADRAISAAPPGHSEHATGYVIDFTVRPADGCPDAEACMAAKPAFRWLAANATRFGFEMSFPASNKQNVKWEPWHWRWVGTSASVPGAARARFLFARARAAFPADPAIDPPQPKVIVPPVVSTIEAPAAAVDDGKKKKKRSRKDRRAERGGASPR